MTINIQRLQKSMGFSWAINSVTPLKIHKLQHHENCAFKFMAFSTTFKFMVSYCTCKVPWHFHGYLVHFRISCLVHGIFCESPINFGHENPNEIPVNYY